MKTKLQTNCFVCGSVLEVTCGMDTEDDGTSMCSYLVKPCAKCNTVMIKELAECKSALAELQQLTQDAWGK